jgi:acetate kinase
MAETAPRSPTGLGPTDEDSHERGARRGPQSDALLVLNAGSSSLKFSAFVAGDPPRTFLHGEFSGLLTRPRFVACVGSTVVGEQTWPTGMRLEHADAIDFLLRWGRSGVLGEHHISAVGHRVVHGGTQFTGPTLVDADTIAELEALIPLAPLHQPHALAAMRAVAQHAPTLPQVACFDTAFHHAMPLVAQAFALPRRYLDEGVRRYGFHGLSYEYIATALPRVAPDAANGRVIVAHLGNGASMCALAAGRSVATTMSFTALDGLMMGTRCGALDPGVLLYLMDRDGLDARGLERLLYEQSGLLGVSGTSSDMRELMATASKESSDPACAVAIEAAKEAIDLFVYRACRELGSLAAALNGVDAIVFTGGIGAHASAIRAGICLGAKWLGLDFDEGANERDGPCISTAGSRVSAWVIPTNEELIIALHTQRLLARS